MSTLVQFDNLADLSEFDCPYCQTITMHPFVMFDAEPAQVITWLYSEGFDRSDFIVWKPHAH